MRWELRTRQVENTTCPTRVENYANDENILYPQKIYHTKRQDTLPLHEHQHQKVSTHHLWEDGASLYRIGDNRLDFHFPNAVHPGMRVGMGGTCSREGVELTLCTISGREDSRERMTNERGALLSGSNGHYPTSTPTTP